MHEKRAHYLFHALYSSPTKGWNEYMKQKCAHTDASNYHVVHSLKHLVVFL